MESEILRGAVRIGLAPSGSSLGLEVASRTDRGVHARGNALTLHSDLPGGSLLRALNGIAPDIWFTRAALVPPEFRVRSARERWYRYLEPDPIGTLAAWTAAARPFRGSVDVRSFGRGLPPDVPCQRDLFGIRVRQRAGVRIVDVRGRSFVWGMVRKIVSALRAHAAGELPVAEIESALRGERRLALPLAEPDRLILWEVRHGVRWTTRSAAPSRGQAGHRRISIAEARARLGVLRALPEVG